jgi:hypothetical protein
MESSRRAAGYLLLYLVSPHVIASAQQTHGDLDASACRKTTFKEKSSDYSQFDYNFA